MKNRNKAGFTLVELMVVAIIVAVLAAVAIPLMSGNKKRAAVTEAEAALGSARSAMRALYAEYKDYRGDGVNVTLGAGDPITEIPGIDAGDFDGRFFSSTDYDIQAAGADTYTLRCQGNGTVDGIDLSGVTITVDEGGQIKKTGM